MDPLLWKNKTNPFLPVVASIAANGTTSHPVVQAKNLGVTIPVFP